MALSQALRRVTLQISRNFGSELPSQISSLNAFIPLQTPRIIVKNVAINAEPSSKRLIHTQIARNARRKVAGRSMPVISVRSLSIKSPLLVDQSSPAFMSFSRRQWYYFFGGFAVLGAITIQYMEIGAVEKLLAGVDRAVLKSPTLAVELFSSAAAFTNSPSLATIARNEPIIALACDALVLKDVEEIVRASAILFLTKVMADEVSHPLVYKHLDLDSLAHDFVKIVKRSDFEKSSAVLIATALSTRPPSADRSKSLEIRQNALIQVYPILLSHLLGKVASNEGFHRTFITQRVPEAMLNLAKHEIETPIGVEFFYHLSSSEMGIKTPSVNSVMLEYLEMTYAADSPLRQLYSTNTVNDHTLVYLLGVGSNIAKYFPRHLLSPQVQNDDFLASFDLQTSLQNKLLMTHIGAAINAAVAACLYAPMRGLVRNWWRSYSMSIPQAITHAAWRAVIGAPLLVVGGSAVFEARKNLKDERLFISATAVGATGILFATRFILSAAPFTLLPAAFAAFTTFSGSAAERAARRVQIERFQKEAETTKSQTDELDD